MIGRTAVCAPGLPSDRLEVSGLLPADATNARLVLDDGSSVPLAVSSGVFAVQRARVKPLPVAVEWNDGAGMQRADTGTPQDADKSDCG